MFCRGQQREKKTIRKRFDEKHTGSNRQRRIVLKKWDSSETSSWAYKMPKIFFACTSKVWIFWDLKLLSSTGEFWITLIPSQVSEKSHLLAEVHTRLENLLVGLFGTRAVGQDCVVVGAEVRVRVVPSVFEFIVVMEEIEAAPRRASSGAVCSQKARQVVVGASKEVLQRKTNKKWKR